MIDSILGAIKTKKPEQIYSGLTNRAQDWILNILGYN